MTPIIGITASSITPFTLGDYESIATVTVTTATQASIEFTSIPGTYTHLQIRYIAKTAANDIIVFQVNDDNGNNYSLHRLFGNGTSASAGASASYNYGTMSLTSGTANTFGAGVCDILDYANTNKYKTFRTIGGREDNSVGVVELRSSLWQSTAAITKIVLTTDSTAAFSQYSHFALYGIRA